MVERLKEVVVLKVSSIVASIVLLYAMRVSKKYKVARLEAKTCKETFGKGSFLC